MDRSHALSWFLDALDEWGTEDNAARARAIIEFIDGGYDLSEYREGPRLRLVEPSPTTPRQEG